MESLSPECTPLKHRYDACFNSWFEGYLQPALDAHHSTSTQTRQPTNGTTPVPNGATGTRADTASEPISSTVPEAGPSQSAERRRIITSWSSAFPDRRRTAEATLTSVLGLSQANDVDDEPDALEPSQPLSAIDTRGKTRTQIKAEEYERNCGAAWRAYQGCLKNAIEQNPSLSALLEQARVEHPLKEKRGLEGTAWDPEYRPKDTK